MLRGCLLRATWTIPPHASYRPFSIATHQLSNDTLYSKDKSELPHDSKESISGESRGPSGEQFSNNSFRRPSYSNDNLYQSRSGENFSTSQPRQFSHRSSSTVGSTSTTPHRGYLGNQRETFGARDTRYSPNNAPSADGTQQRPSFAPKTFDESFQRPILSARAQIIRAARSMTMKVLDLRRTVKVTKGGKTYSFSVLVVLGDKNGRGGLGQAKGKDIPDALEKATIDAYKNTVMIPMTSNQTIHHVLQEKFKATRISMRPAPLEHGVRAHEVIMNICDAIGIKNLSSKVIGSTNAHNVAKGAFRAMQMQVEPAMVAKWRGRRLFDVGLSATFKSQGADKGIALHNANIRRNVQ